jgi:broad specificity phosphatase PhoE
VLVTSSNGAAAILLRHGMTEWNQQGRFTSATDIGLHPDAPRQLLPTAAALASRGIERILLSPLRRARETEAILRQAGALGSIPAVIVEDLRELDFGEFEGKTKQQLGTGLFAEAYRKWLREEFAGPAAPGGESLSDAAARAARVLESVAMSRRRTLIVSHGYLLKVMVSVALPHEDRGSVRDSHFANGEIVSLERDGNVWRRSN